MKKIAGPGLYAVGNPDVGCPLQQAKLHEYCRDSATVTPCRGDGKESTFVPLAFSGRYLTQRTGGRADHPEMVLFLLVDAYNFATTKSIVICQFGKNVQ